MKRVLVGHRGVGKSCLLERHKEYFPAVPAFDLDQEIERKTQKTIADIFCQEGESKFRQLENEIFHDIMQKDSFVLSVGGGFNPLNIPKSIEVIFLSRRTDSDGRIFLNRPLINPQLSDLEDSLALYQQRHPRFLHRADVVYHMPEGITEFNKLEKHILTGATGSVKAYVTVVKNNVQELRHNALELRTDLLSIHQIKEIVQQSAQKEILISYRKRGDQLLDIPPATNVLFDWGLELGWPPKEFIQPLNIISIHEGSLEEGMTQLQKFPEAQLKLCPVINTWEELILGYRWQQENPTARSFLPRTGSGKSKYRWFRILAQSFQKLNFVQGFTDRDDQPSFYEFMSAKSPTWGAVLGFPIHHSRSCVEQTVIGIPLEEKDFKVAMPFLTELGMRYAAVTSPLKIMAGDVNSLVFKNGQWSGASTDPQGFKKLMDQVPTQFKQAVAVWGGEGVLSALRKEIPEVQCFSARTGELKTTGAVKAPEVLIWAAPRLEGIQLPQKIYPHWKPQIILDLNYTENSMGLECAKQYHNKYISGLNMFLEQAQYQREFWKGHL